MAQQTSAQSSLSETALHDIINKRRGQQRKSSYILWGVIGAVCIFAAVKALTADNTPMAEIVVVDEQVEPGQRVGLTGLKYRRIAASFATTKMFTSCEHLIGRVAKRALVPFEPIVEADLFPENSTFSAYVRPGNRAISIELARDALLDRCFTSGDHVDVVATVAKNGQKYTQTIAQDVEVICASSSNERRSQTQLQRATLCVAAADAETITEASEVGKLRLLLRNPQDHAVVASDGRDVDDVLPRKARTVPIAAMLTPPSPARLAPPPPPVEAVLPPPTPIAPAAPRPTWTVENFSGSRRTVQEFYEGGSSPQPPLQPSDPVEAPPPAVGSMSTYWSRQGQN